MLQKEKYSFLRKNIFWGMSQAQGIRKIFFFLFFFFVITYYIYILQLFVFKHK